MAATSEESQHNDTNHSQSEPMPLLRSDLELCRYRSRSLPLDSKDEIKFLKDQVKKINSRIASLEKDLADQDFCSESGCRNSQSGSNESTLSATNERILLAANERMTLTTEEMKPSDLNKSYLELTETFPGDHEAGFDYQTEVPLPCTVGSYRGLSSKQETKQLEIPTEQCTEQNFDDYLDRKYPKGDCEEHHVSTAYNEEIERSMWELVEDIYRDYDSQFELRSSLSGSSEGTLSAAGESTQSAAGESTLSATSESTLSTTTESTLSATSESTLSATNERTTVTAAEMKLADLNYMSYPEITKTFPDDHDDFNYDVEVLLPYVAPYKEFSSNKKVKQVEMPTEQCTKQSNNEYLDNIQQSIDKFLNGGHEEQFGGVARLKAWFAKRSEDHKFMMELMQD